MLKPKLKQLTQIRRDTVDYLTSLFLLNDEPFNKSITEGQMRIFASILFQDRNRSIICCSTQYGKSLVVALACLILSCIQGKRVSVVAPTNEKAKIIMRYFLEHLGDNPLFYRQIEKNTKLDRLRQEESKDRIIFRNNGGIFIVSAQQHNSNKSIESAMGQGADIVIMDEACLITDDTEATIFRMIAGKGKDAFYCKIGNPFYSVEPYSHFKNSWEDDRYDKVFVNDEVGLAEGRYTQEFLNEAKKKPLYDVLFKSEFPDEDDLDRDGYRRLLVTNQLEYAPMSLLDEQEDDFILGVDIGGGGDKSKFVIRRGNFAFVASTINSTDTMLNVDEAIRLADMYNIRKDKVFVDDTGIGRGVSDMLKQHGYYNCGVSFGESAFRKELFANRRVEMYWDTAEWVKAGGKLCEANTGWVELTWTRYKVHTGEKKIILENKELVRQRFRASPDTADALALTFVKRRFVGVL